MPEGWGGGGDGLQDDGDEKKGKSARKKEMDLSKDGWGKVRKVKKTIWVDGRRE